MRHISISFAVFAVVLTACKKDPAIVVCGTAQDCDDGDPCTVDGCIQGECTTIETIPACFDCAGDQTCDDGDPCTVNECVDLSCIIVETIPECVGCVDDTDCDDGDPCNAEACIDEVCTVIDTVPDCGGCVDDTDCDDEDDCTVDECVEGECTNATIPGCGGCVDDAQCDDGDRCTVDACVEAECTNETIPDCGGCDAGAPLEGIAGRLGEIIGVEVTEQVCGAQELPGGNPTTHSDGVQVTNAEEEVDWIAVTSFVVDLPGDVPCGEGKDYTVLCTGQTLPLGGTAVVMLGQVAGPIDLAEAMYSYQYGFVFDSDGDPSNNYVPAPAYPADFFADTDLWLYTVHPAGEDWYTWASSASADFANVPSSERIIIIDDVVVLVVDADEVDPATATWRMTSFRHQGDYGTSLPWSGDVVPAVGDPLAPL